MPIQKLADETAAEIVSTLNVDADKTAVVSRAVEKAVIAALLDARSHYVNVVKGCCEEDKDLAHKISQEMEQKEAALIANLSSLR